jgi:hypothetical protein
MRFERENGAPVINISERELRRLLGRKRGGDNTFAILEADDGSYVQMLGGGVACCLEWRDMNRRCHYRAFVDPPKVPWREPCLLGQVQVRPQEILFIEQIVDAFCAFLNGSAFPSEVQWRDVTEELGDHGVARP